MLGLSPNISVITLNLSRPDTLVQKRRIAKLKRETVSLAEKSFQAEAPASAKAREWEKQNRQVRVVKYKDQKQTWPESTMEG